MHHLCGAATALELYKPPYPTALNAVYLINDPDYNGAEYYIVVNVGEADMKGPEGLSHYLEHIALFSASDRKHGARTISVDENAYAYKLATVFYAYGESSADTSGILKRFRGLFQPIELDRQFMREERRIVEREFEQRTQLFPLYLDGERVWRMLFGANHLGRSVLGNTQSIRALSIDDALAAHATYYHTGNASLYVIGDINYSSMANHIKSVFPAAKDSLPLNQREKVRLEAKRYQADVQRDNIFRDRLIFKKAIKFPSQYDWAQKLVLRDHLHEILSSSYPSGLRKALQHDAFWAADLEIELDFVTENILVLEIFAAPDFNVELEDLSQEIEKQLELIAENGVSRMTFYDLKQDTELFYADLKNTPADLHGYVLLSLILNAEPIEGNEIDRAARALTHLDFDAVMKAIAAPSDTAIRFLRTKE